MAVLQNFSVRKLLSFLYGRYKNRRLLGVVICFPDIRVNTPTVRILAENGLRTTVVETCEPEHIFLFWNCWLEAED